MNESLEKHILAMKKTFTPVPRKDPDQAILPETLTTLNHEEADLRLHRSPDMITHKLTAGIYHSPGRHKTRGSKSPLKNIHSHSEFVIARTFSPNKSSPQRKSHSIHANRISFFEEHRERFCQEEFELFQKEGWRDHPDFHDERQSDYLVLIEFCYNRESKECRALNETPYKYKITALELADWIQRKFPFIDVLIKPGKDESDYTQYRFGCFNVQICTKDFSIRDLFIDKVNVKVRLHYVFEQEKILSNQGYMLPDFFAKYFEGMEVIIRQKPRDYAFDKDGRFEAYIPKIDHKKDRAKMLEEVLEAKKCLYYTRTDEIDRSSANISGELGIHNKQNVIPCFMTKGRVSNKGEIVFHGIAKDVDSYEIEALGNEYFKKAKTMISLKSASLEEDFIVNMELELKHLSDCNVNVYDGFLPLSNAQIRISNNSTFNNNDEDHPSVTEEYQHVWAVTISENIPKSGNYAFFAMPGKYYMEVSCAGYNKVYKTLHLTAGVNVFDIELNQTLVNNITLVTKNILSKEGVDRAKIKIYESAGQLVANGETNNKGELELPLGFLRNYRIFTQREGYVDVFQEIRIDSETFQKRVEVLLIPITLQQGCTFEVYVVYHPSLFDYLFSLKAPDGGIVSQKNPTHPNYNVRYEELNVDDENVIKFSVFGDYRPEDAEFELYAGKKSLYRNPSSSEIRGKSRQPSPLGKDTYLGTDGGAHKVPEKGPNFATPTKGRIASSLFVSNRLSVASTVLNKSSEFASGKASKFVTTQNSSQKKPAFDLHDFVPLNRSLRVFVICHNVLQDVIYSQFKKFEGRYWQIGILNAYERSFIRKNEPNLQYEDDDSRMFRDQQKRTQFEPHFLHQELKTVHIDPRDLLNKSLRPPTSTGGRPEHSRSRSINQKSPKPSPFNPS